MEVLEKLWLNFNEMARDRTTIHELNQNKQGMFVHNHGWGISWMKNGKIQTHHSLNPVWQDKLPNTIKEEILSSRVFILHARQASPGLPVKIESVHPFVRESKKFGEICLAHNGTIRDYKSIKINPEFKQQADSDTERFLLSLITRFDNGDNAPIIDQIRKAISEIPDYSGLNFISIINDNLISSRNFNANENYLSLFYGTNGDSVIISSEKIQSLPYDWTLLKNHEIIEIPLKLPQKYVVTN